MTAGPLWDRLSLVLSPGPNGYGSPRRRLTPQHRLFDTSTIEAVRRGLWSVETLSRCIVEASADCIEVLDPQGNLQFANPTALQQLRSSDTAENEGEPWALSWPDEVRAAVLEELKVVRETGVARFSHWRPGLSGEARYWDVTLSRMLDDDGDPIGLLAVSRDITALAQAETDRDLCNRELSHRLKNVFALVNGLVTLSARTIPVVQPYARTLRDRFTSLGRALEYLHVSPQDEAAPRPAQTLQALLRTLLMPYDGVGSAHRRIRLFDGAVVPIRDTAVTSLALIIHELATNAVKYGALSDDTGTVSLSCRRYDKSISLIWCERGGPPIERPPEHAGFGSTLVQRSLSGQLGGKITYHWEPEGLRVLISMPTDLLLQEAT
ncbi:PAS domain-containing protein [Methylobacterium sp. J-072]|uniref:PAS domain-containing protein n=1 Tax=Methylobacterium sp. J-072 TaxID=2836651 RepID=UPI001FB91E37|nr:PAS domain-containing protein [Methylobacterium sp. J-072]MCJ2093829.1 PAS domain-containing protein [Methylobacterium sp. J-072]